jgi:hypothetical protein
LDYGIEKEIRLLKEEIEKLKGMLSQKDVLTCTAPKTQNNVHLRFNELINKLVIDPRFLATINFLNKLKKKEFVLVSAFLICKGGENYG